MTQPPDLPEQAEIRRLIQMHARQAGGLLPLLHAIQDHRGFVPPEAVGLIAQGMNLSRAEVHGVLSFYQHFRSAPPGRHVVQVCRAEACQACGGEALMAHAQRLLACGDHETRPDGAVTLESVHCLGLCASSPAIQVDDRLHARVTPDKLARVLRSVGLIETGSTQAQA